MKKIVGSLFEMQKIPHHSFHYLLILLPIVFRIANSQNSNRHVFRQYTCIANDELELADCRLNFFMTSDDEPSTVTQSGCFIEKDPKSQELRHFCPLQCQGASFAYIWAHRPTPPAPPLRAADGRVGERAPTATAAAAAATDEPCLATHTFDVSRRRSDWFLWRSRDCLTTESQFDIGCVFATADGRTHLPRGGGSGRGASTRDDSPKFDVKKRQKSTVSKNSEMSKDFLLVEENSSNIPPNSPANSENAAAPAARHSERAESEASGETLEKESGNKEEMLESSGVEPTDI